VSLILCVWVCLSVGVAMCVSQLSSITGFSSHSYLRAPAAQQNAIIRANIAAAEAILIGKRPSPQLK